MRISGQFCIENFSWRVGISQNLFQYSENIFFVIFYAKLSQYPQITYYSYMFWRFQYKAYKASTKKNQIDFWKNHVTVTIAVLAANLFKT